MSSKTTVTVMLGNGLRTTSRVGLLKIIVAVWWIWESTYVKTGIKL